jgi:hypothetical protein
MKNTKPIPGKAAVDRVMRTPPELKIPGPADEPLCPCRRPDGLIDKGAS